MDNEYLERQTSIKKQPQDQAQEAEETETELVSCPDCGKQVKRKGLGIHRAKAHGAGAKKRKKKGKRGKKSDGNAPAELEAAFSSVLAAMQEQSQFAEEVMDGLQRLLAEAKRLRMAYIKRTKQLHEMGVEITELNSEVNDGQ